MYSGTPGSGKSLHLAKEIITNLKQGKIVIANFEISLSKRMKRYQNNFLYYDNSEMNVKLLYELSAKYKKGIREGQIVLIIDECAVMFNSRDYARKDRSEWILFLQQHRKLGYRVILVAQSDRMIDRQIRAFIEYDVRHKKANNFGAIGLFLTLFGIKLFSAVTYWYGQRERCGAEFFRYKRAYGNLYDTTKIFK